MLLLRKTEFASYLNFLTSNRDTTIKLPRNSLQKSHIAIPNRDKKPPLIAGFRLPCLISSSMVIFNSIVI